MCNIIFKMPYCTLCSTSVNSKSWVGHLRSAKHKQNDNCVAHSGGVDIVSSAFRSRIITYRITASDELSSADAFFDSISDKVKSLLNESLHKHTCLKVNFELYSVFLMIKDNKQEIKSFGTKNTVLYSNYDFDLLYVDVLSKLKKKIEEFTERDSGWTLLNHSHLEININKYQPLGGSNFIDLPKNMKNKRACLNIRNYDDYCFIWCVTAALYPVTKHPERVSSYPDFRTVFNVDKMHFPVAFADIHVFEKNNPHIKFIVYGLKNEKTIIGPVYKSNEINKTDKVIHLLLLENDSSSHYCLIKNLSRLVRRQLTSHHGKVHLCDTCLIFFNTTKELDDHSCGGIVTILPEKGSVIKFKNYNHKQDIPFVIYADFESLLEKCGQHVEQSKSVNTCSLQRHVPAAFGYHIVCSIDESYNRYVSYRGPDCVDKFIDTLYKDVSDINKILGKHVPIAMNEQNIIDFENATRCHICEHFLYLDKVRDHCHISGRYRGAAHSYCNLQYQLRKFIPIFFHNLSGYDCHLFIKKLGEAPGPIKIIPKTKENYICFTKFVPVSEDEFVQLRFVDSLKFLGASLENLVKTIDKNEFELMSNYFPNEVQLKLLMRKGIYPYEYMDKWERYNEQSLPSHEHFYSSLTNDNITNDDYRHAQLVWCTFHIQNLGEYTDLYLKTDVLLLSEIFERFRKTCKTHYHLDPAFYVTAPSLSFDAMLLNTGVELELIDNLEIIKLIQNGIRGGICMCSHRYAKANNKYLPNYDDSKADSYIAYIDCNNLYGFSMCQPLPISDFRLLEPTEINNLDVLNISNNAEYGFILEVDLMYPDNLHDTHNDLPFCPEKCTPPGGRLPKLVPNLHDKYFYVMHYVHLKTCIKHGLIVKKIHRAIKFRQLPFLKKYIDFNTALRQKATSTFEQDFFKLLNNSIFGKTLENTEKRVTVKLVNMWDDKNNVTKKKLSANKIISSPSFHSASVFTENLVAIQLKPERVILDKPIYIGFTVLELSKSHMYDFHYSVIRPHYDNRVRMCYTDTDSFIYHIETKDFYKDICKIFLEYFDTSNFDSKNKFGLPIINKKVPGLFKDELSGKVISEFVGLRAKLYCVKTEEYTMKKAKGVKGCVVRDLTVSDYKNTLYNDDVIRKINVLFKSIKHDIFTNTVNKVALSSNDDKRLIMKNKTNTTAWGHASILNLKRR